MKLTHNYIGGEFAINDLIPFQGISDFEQYFPISIKNKKIAFFETAIDAITQIIVNKSMHLSIKTINLWIPYNYCFESISRLKFKLHFHNLQIANVYRFITLNQIIKNSLVSFVIVNHYNMYEDFEFHESDSNNIIIEDFVQSPLDIYKFKGDYAVNSLRKFCNIDVSIAFIDERIHKYSEEKTEYYTYRKKAQELKKIFFDTKNSSLEEKYLELFFIAEYKLNNYQINFANIDEINKLKTINFNSIYIKRKNNYNYLHHKLTNLPKLTILKGEYMYFMITTKYRDKLKIFLAENGIFTAIHWKDSYTQLSEVQLSLHIDHRYNTYDLERVYSNLVKFFELHG